MNDGAKRFQQDEAFEVIRSVGSQLVMFLAFHQSVMLGFENRTAMDCDDMANDFKSYKIFKNMRPITALMPD